MASMTIRSSFQASPMADLTQTKANPFLHSRTKPFTPPPKKLLRLTGIYSRNLVDPIRGGYNTSVAAEKNTEKVMVVTALVRVRKNKDDLKSAIVGHLDAFADTVGRNVLLQLISTEIEPGSKEGKRSKEARIRDWAKKWNQGSETVEYMVEFELDSGFGRPGAVAILNRHQREFFLETITLEGSTGGPVYFNCYSWVQSTNHYNKKRVFFYNQPFLPADTPESLRGLREEELRRLRGSEGGGGERKLTDHIYDYDVYNDLGDPDQASGLTRSTLGGDAIPYPRRCRTGRPPTRTDKGAERRVEDPMPMYTPRDEQFEELKVDTFAVGKLKAVLHNLVPSLMAALSSHHQEFKDFSDVDSLYQEGVPLPTDLLKKLPLPKFVSHIHESSRGGSLLRYDTPNIVSRDKFAWLRDDEFARQAIAGINPVSIERLRFFPPRSKLDPNLFGPQESALTEDYIVPHLGGMSVQQAMERNKLFMIDYHDLYMPFLDKINVLDGRKSYATRTIFFLTEVGTLKPVAIELSLPPASPKSGSRRVVTPPVDATSYWIWKLAKAHVCSNDAGVHQLVNHWLRTHASIEPFILAAHRQLSGMHPIYKLLDPHMRYTLGINALARQSLINADGIIESCFTPGPYCMQISAAAYRTSWRFDQESLPADLIRRGMAEADEKGPHGVRLILEDYPYADDGLLLWSAIEEWVNAYVSHYYKDEGSVARDSELQAWYAEAIEMGHADLSRRKWWPEVRGPGSLSGVLTTLIWLASAQHAALNFGQYPYGGYVPNRPPLMRRLIPEEGDPEHAQLMADPERFFLSSMPSKVQATKFMAVVDTLSTHSPDEEYIGERRDERTWTGDQAMLQRFQEFSRKMKHIEEEMGRRNGERGRRNRCGAGVLPYQLLLPTSPPGVTCRGVPNSVSI